MSRPTVLVTKRLPSLAMSRLEEACDVDLNDRDTFLTHDELVARVRGKQGLIAMLPDTVDRAVLEAGLPDLKVVAAVAVGINNIDAKTAAGFGRIGRAVAARAAAFGVRVAYFARNPQAPKVEGYDPMPLDRLLATSDIVSLHCPLTPETRHLIDQTALARMKR